MRVFAKLFLEYGDDYIIGPGRIDLLRAIEELGSLRKAADKLGMSYRWAWGRLKNAEQDLGVSLMVRTTKKIGGRPNTLTKEAHELLAWYENIENIIEKTLDGARQNQPDFLRKLANKTL